jgi:hypothetical protein
MSEAHEDTSMAVAHEDTSMAVAPVASPCCSRR